MKTNTIVALGAGALLLIGATAGASVYVMDNMNEEKPSTATEAKVSSNERVIYTEERATVRTVNCDDDNIVGKVVGGAAGGTLLGEEYIPTRNVTCK